MTREAFGRLAGVPEAQPRPQLYRVRAGGHGMALRMRPLPDAFDRRSAGLSALGTVRRHPR